MSDTEWTIVIAAVLGALGPIGLLLWGKISREKFVAVVRGLTPDLIEPLAVQAFDIAWKAVEQKAEAYRNMTNEQKLEWAKDAAIDILIFLKTGKLTDKANEAMIEYRLYEERQRERRVPVQESVR